jgi:IclR family pca regulon transcriptional regulator
MAGYSTCKGLRCAVIVNPGPAIAHSDQGSADSHSFSCEPWPRIEALFADERCNPPPRPSHFDKWHNRRRSVVRARGLLVIQSFSPQSPQMTISQLSVKTGLSRAAVRRCLYTLSKLGFAGVEDGSRYALRPRMLTLSNTYSASNSLSTAAQPILERMSAVLRESFSVATLDGDDIVYIARSSVSRVMSDDLHIGSRLPAYCTSMGRVLLAYLPAEQLEQYLAHVVLTQHTPRTVSSVEKLRLALRNVRRHGYALVDQEYEIGLRSIAVPVHAPTGRVVATLNLSGSAPRMPAYEMQSRFLPHLRNAAAELGAFLR